MKNELASSDDKDFNKKKIEILAELTRLRQVCCDPRLCYDNYDGSSAKLDSCMELIQMLQQSSVVEIQQQQLTSLVTVQR